MGHAQKSRQERPVIHQFQTCVSEGDAITQQMLFIRKSLKEARIDGELFAERKAVISGQPVHALSVTELAKADRILIHHATGNPQLPTLLSINVPKALVYHNITPGIYYRHDPYLRSLLELGRRQLRQLRDSVVATFADSRFNAGELENLGFPKVQVFPLFDLKSVPTPRRPHPRSESRQRRLLFVGKICAHKNQALLVQILYCLKQMSLARYQIVLVGKSDPVYREYLKLLSRALEVEEDVSFAGKAPQGKLIDYYRNADAFVCSSLHEGFCIPLIEAMCSRLPVFALASAAVPETLGGAGVAIHTQNPQPIAALIDAVLSSRDSEEGFCSAILKGQEQRLEQLSDFQCSRTVQSLCQALLQAP